MPGSFGVAIAPSVIGDGCIRPSSVPGARRSNDKAIVPTASVDAAMRIAPEPEHQSHDSAAK